MGNRGIKIGLGLALLGYAVYQAVLRGAKALVVRMDSYSVKEVGITDGTVSLILNILIYNPLLVGLWIKGITGTVYMKDEKVGTIDKSFNYYLEGRKQHILPVDLKLQVKSLGKAVIENIKSGDINNLTIGFDGKVLVGEYYVGIPVKLNVKYSDI